jgi:organic hydroperoxide reductase OsmC/OhrA
VCEVALHHFSLTVARERGSNESGVSPRKRARRHVITAEGKPPILGSAATSFHGEVERWNPEELFIASLAQCHLLSFLYVVERDDLGEVDCTVSAEATLEVDSSGAGRITTVTLTPSTVIAGDVDAAIAAHEEAHTLCFIANSVSCTVEVTPRVERASAPETQG